MHQICPLLSEILYSGDVSSRHSYTWIVSNMVVRIVDSFLIQVCHGGIWNKQ